jgi:hypothetical protein
MVGIAPRRATVGRVERPTTAADLPPAEAGVPSAEEEVVDTPVAAEAEAVVVDTPVAAEAEAEAAIPVAGATLAEAIDKFETFERVEVSRKLM